MEYPRSPTPQEIESFHKALFLKVYGGSANPISWKKNHVAFGIGGEIGSMKIPMMESEGKKIPWVFFVPLLEAASQRMNLPLLSRPAS